MRILLINKFFYLKGGPERYVFNIAELLKSRGHEIAFFSMQHSENVSSEWDKYFVKNVDYNKKHGLTEQIKIFKNTLYSAEAKIKVSRLIDDFRPDIAHLHNFNHQLTPSILYALKEKNIPIVMTMHDFKLVCPSYSMLNHGKPCELCIGRKFFHCLRTKCQKDSFNQSFLLSLESYLHHSILGSYRLIDSFICPSKFLMHKTKEMGLKGSFKHISNFVEMKSESPLIQNKNKVVCFGRLSIEKGVFTLLDAVKGLPIELDLIGEGPLRKRVEEKIAREGIKNIHILGYLSGKDLFSKIKESLAAIIPSQCYENNPISVIEAFTLGLSVIGARIGGIPELITEGETGLLFNPGDSMDLRDKIKYLIDNPEKAIQMGRNAAEIAKKEYNAGLHYERLIKAYNDVVNMYK